MRGTSRSTPVAPAPHETSPGKGERAYELKAPIVVVWTGGERELERGDLVIGRGPASGITLEDPLVSRAHACLVISADGSVVVEDLHSANGVFVNGVRVTQRSARLNEGDRLLIGTTELSLFSGRASATLPINREVLSRPVSVNAPMESATRIPIARIERPRGVQLAAGAASPIHPTTQPTTRTTPIGMIGRLAETLLKQGRRNEANALIAEHLKKIMVGASAGLPVPEDILHAAALLALELWQRTSDRAWQTYALDLHVLAGKVPSSKTLEVLESNLDRAGAAIDPAGLSYLVESLGARFEQMTTDERNRFRHLSALARDSRRG